MFISLKRSLPVPVGWREHIMQVLYRRSGGLIERAHGVVANKEGDRH